MHNACEWDENKDSLVNSVSLLALINIMRCYMNFLTILRVGYVDGMAHYDLSLISSKTPRAGKRSYLTVRIPGNMAE